MISNKEDTSGSAEGQTVVERWTLDRIDREAHMARIEVVPMRPECITRELLDALFEPGKPEIEDSLALWDSSRATTRRCTLAELIESLGLPEATGRQLSENQVYWVLKGAGGKEQRVVHATLWARKLAKQLYQKAIRRGGDES